MGEEESTTFGAPARIGLGPSKLGPTPALVLRASLNPAPGLSSSPRVPRGAATSPPLPGPGEAALPVNSPPRAAPSPPRLHPRGTLGGVRLARTRCHSPDASPPSFPTAWRPAVLLVHRGAAAEGSTVPGSLGTRRQVGALAHLSRVPGLQSHGAVRVPPARQDALGDGQLEKLTEPLRARGSLAAQRCAALATEVSAVLTQMCAGHPASAAGKLHPKSKVGSEGGTSGWTAGLPAGRRVLRLPGPGEGGDPTGNFLSTFLTAAFFTVSSSFPTPTGAAASGLPRVLVCQRSRPGEDRRRGAASSGETRSPDAGSGRPGCARTGPAAADGRRQRSLAAERLGALPLDRLSAGRDNLRSDARGGPVAALQ